MNRRKFLGMGVLSSLATAVGTEASAESVDEEEVPRFRDRDVLTSDQLNRLVDEINRLKRVARGG